jgi:tetratricopeptide (TPR) repeat protein
MRSLLEASEPLTAVAEPPRLNPFLAQLQQVHWLDTPVDGRRRQRGAVEFLAPPGHAGELGSLGPYRLQAELGRGGMGIVYRAYDNDLQRTVAVKVLRLELACDPASRARFVREAQTAARVQHDNLVSVHAVVAAPDALPYLVLEYVSGPSLAELIRTRRQLESREAATLMAQAADGLAAAHAGGLIHRDVKPSNLLIDSETQRIKLSDFGLARFLTGTSAMTQQGVLAGTPAYMSPEQAVGQDQLDGRTDVYSLGVTLYEALTGEVPFRGAPHLVLAQVLEDDPRPPRQLNDRVPHDLETICLKAMAKEPVRRYATAGELADDLRRWLKGEAIHARPVGRLERVWRWCRRNPWVAGLSVALVVVVVGAFAGVLGQWRRAEREHQLAEARLRDAVGAVDRFYTLVSQNRLLTEPGMQPLRKELLATARDYYERFARDRRGDPAIQRALGRALFNLGSITWEIESPEAALKHFEEALRIQQELARQRPDDQELQADLAHTLNNLANTYVETKRYSEAIDIRFAGLALSRRLVEQDPTNPAGHLGLFRTYHNLGLLYHGSSLATQAEEAYRESIAAARRLAENDPRNTYYRFKQLASELVLALLYREEGRLADATKVLEQAQSLTRDCPRVAECEILVASHSADRAIVEALAAQGEGPAEYGRRLKAAETRLNAALAKVRALVDTNPALTELRVTHSIYLTWDARLNQALGRTREADAQLKEALKSTEKLAKDYPRSLTYAAAEFPVRLRLACLESDTGRGDRVLDLSTRMRGELAEGPRHAYFGHLLRPTAIQSAMTHCELGRFDESLADWDVVLAEDAGKYKQRLDAFLKRFDWNAVLADGTGRYRQLWQACRALTEARRAGGDRRPLAATLAVEAAKEAEAYQQTELLNGGWCYWFARIHATASGQSEFHAARAVELLRRAGTMGYFGIASRVALLREDREFDPLRGRGDFRKLLAEVTAKRTK